MVIWRGYLWRLSAGEDSSVTFRIFVLPSRCLFLTFNLGIHSCYSQIFDVAFFLSKKLSSHNSRSGVERHFSLCLRSSSPRPTPPSPRKTLPMTSLGRVMKYEAPKSSNETRNFNLECCIWWGEENWQEPGGATRTSNKFGQTRSGVLDWLLLQCKTARILSIVQSERLHCFFSSVFSRKNCILRETAVYVV